VNRIQEVLLKFAEQNAEMNNLMKDHLELCSFLYDLGHQQSKVLVVKECWIAPKWFFFV